MKFVLSSLIAVAVSMGTLSASQEATLGWTSVVIQAQKTPEAGQVTCYIKTGEKGWERFVIQAFGKTHILPPSELEKLDGFPLSSLRTTHEPGYKELGGYKVHFRFERAFYNPDKKLITEIIYVSVDKNKVSVSDRRIDED